MNNAINYARPVKLKTERFFYWRQGCRHWGRLQGIGLPAAEMNCPADSPGLKKEVSRTRQGP